MAHPNEWIILNHKNNIYKDLQMVWETTYKVLSNIEYCFYGKFSNI